MGRFVTTEVVRLPLSAGDWIEVKKRLSYSELQHLTTVGLLGMQGAADETVAEAALRVDYGRWRLERIATWLTDWSFKDDNDKAVRFSREAVKNLDADTGEEIQAALDAHLTAMEEEGKASNGKSPTGTPSS